MGDEIEYPCELVDSADKAGFLLKSRPAYFHVEVQRTGRYWSRLGVQVVIAGDREVRVQNVRERGLIPEWNASHEASQQVRPGDRITHVNNVTANAKELNDALQNAVMGEVLSIRVVTPQATVHRRLCHSPAESTASGDTSLAPSRTSSLGSNFDGA
jgi:hypothetical protein